MNENVLFFYSISEYINLPCSYIILFKVSEVERMKGEAKSGSFTPKKGDFVICSLTEISVEWPDSAPLVKYFVGQIIFIEGKRKALIAIIFVITICM